MKRFNVVSVFIVCVLLVLSGIANAGNYHFNHNEALQIAGGVWHTSHGDVKFIGTFSDGSSGDNIIENGLGYTDPNKTSQIYFGYKGATACIQSTYYPDQGVYYADVSVDTSGKGNWKVIHTGIYKAR